MMVLLGGNPIIMGSLVCQQELIWQKAVIYIHSKTYPEKLLSKSEGKLNVDLPYKVLKPNLRTT
jgi:hypothetical protein